MILLVLLLLASLMALPQSFRAADKKRFEVRSYLLAFTVYVTILVGSWLCVALPVLLLMKCIL